MSDEIRQATELLTGAVADAVDMITRRGENVLVLRKQIETLDKRVAALCGLGCIPGDKRLKALEQARTLADACGADTNSRLEAIEHRVECHLDGTARHPARLANVEEVVEILKKELRSAQGTLYCLVDAVKSGDDPGSKPANIAEAIGVLRTATMEDIGAAVADDDDPGPGPAMATELECLCDGWAKFKAGKVHADTVEVLIRAVLDAAGLTRDVD